MTFLILAGILLSFLSGASLGLLGGGGSMLTVPILYYMMKYSAAEATSTSLFIVGCTSLVGAASAFRKREVALRQAIVFVIPSLIGIFLMRRFILPAIPEQLGTIGGHVLTKSASIMALFSLALVYVGARMLRTPRVSENHTSHMSVQLEPHVPPVDIHFKTIISGFGVGSFTGIIGAGGGFLIVPALTLLLKLPFKVAIGTSLFIITINSFVGVASNVSQLSLENWQITSGVLVSSILGMFTGIYFSKKISTSVLKTVFAILVLILVFFIFAKEFL